MTDGGPLREPSKTGERSARHRRKLAAQLSETLVTHEMSPEREIAFWQRAASILAPRPWMAEVRANFVLFIAVLLVSYSGWCIWDRFVNDLPSTVESIAAIDSSVHAGEKLGVRTSLIRHRICERDFEWIVQDAKGNRVRFREAHMHGIGNPGPDTFVQKHQIPTDMEPGPAHLRYIWSWSCPENVYELLYPVTLIAPDVPFEILPGGARDATPPAKSE